MLDADGRPVPGATVYCASNPFVLMVGTSVEKVPHVVTDASGNFRFAPNTVDPRGPGVLVAFHPAKGISKMQTVKREPRDLRLIPLKPFTGKVTDAEGKAVAGAQVRLLFASGQVEGEGVLSPAVEPFVVITDSEGAFTLPVPEGMLSLMVSCRATGYAPQEHFVNPGKDGNLSADALQIELSPSAKLKARFVQARTGAPVGGLPVLVGALSITQFFTDAEGRLSIDIPLRPVEIAPGWDTLSPTLVPAGTFLPVRAQASQPGIEVDLGTIEVVTTPNVTIEVREQTGKVVPYALLSFRTSVGSVGFAYVTDAQGRLSLPLADGTYQVSAISTGWEEEEMLSTREVSLVVRGGKLTTSQPVLLTASRQRVSRPRELRLQVRTSRNQVPKKPWALVASPFMPETDIYRVEKDTVILRPYVVRGERLPRIVVMDTASGEGAVLKNVTATKSPTQVRLKPLPRVYGRVLDSAGKPIARATVRLILVGTEVVVSDGKSFSFWSESITPTLASADPSGRFAVPILPEFTCWALVQARGYAPGVVAVARGKLVTVRLRRAEHQYAGTVVTLFGEPVAGARVRAEHLPPSSRDSVPANGVPRMPTQGVLLKEVHTDAQGRFSFSGMPERLRLSVGGNQPDMGIATLMVKPACNLLVVLATPTWARAGREMVVPKVDLLLKRVEWLNQAPQLPGKETLLVFTAPYLAPNESLFESLGRLPAERWQVVIVFDAYHRQEVEQYCKRVPSPGVVGYWNPHAAEALPVPIHEAVPGLPYLVVLDSSGKPQRFGVKPADLSRTLSAVP